MGHFYILSNEGRLKGVGTFYKNNYVANKSGAFQNITVQDKLKFKYHYFQKMEKEKEETFK